MAAVPSAIFSATLPVKPSVTTTSTTPAVMSLPSTKPWKSIGSGALAQHRRGAAHHVVALVLLGADIEQADARLGARPASMRAKTSPITANWNRCSASQSTLAPRSSTTTGRCCAGMHRGDRRPVDARQRLQHELGHRHQRAGIAGRDRGRRRRRPSPRRSPAACWSCGPGAAPCDGLASPATAVRRVVHASSAARSCGVPRQQRLEARLVAEQQEAQIGMLLERQRGAVDHDRRRSVAAHGVERDGQAVIGSGCVMPGRRQWRRSGASAPKRPGGPSASVGI